MVGRSSWGHVVAGAVVVGGRAWFLVVVVPPRHHLHLPSPREQLLAVAGAGAGLARPGCPRHRRCGRRCGHCPPSSRRRRRSPLFFVVVVVVPRCLVVLAVSSPSRNFVSLPLPLFCPVVHPAIHPASKWLAGEGRVAFRRRLH